MTVAVGTARNYRRIMREWSGLAESRVAAGLHLFLKRGYEGATVILTDRKSGRFIQFRKYINAPAEFGMEMHFPRAEWSQPFYRGVQDVLQRHKVEFARVPLTDAPIVEVIHADFGRNADIAAQVTCDIVREVFGLPAVSLDFRANDICPLDESVERSDHPRPAEMLRKRFKNSVGF